MSTLKEVKQGMMQPLPTGKRRAKVRFDNRATILVTHDNPKIQALLSLGKPKNLTTGRTM